MEKDTLTHRHIERFSKGIKRTFKASTMMYESAMKFMAIMPLNVINRDQ
jgi:hypothetical protein